MLRSRSARWRRSAASRTWRGPERGGRSRCSTTRPRRRCSCARPSTPTSSACRPRMPPRRLRAMPTLQDGTQPMIAHGAVYLRPAERSDVPLFVSWMNDWGTSPTLGLVAPMSLPMEEHWFERVVESQGKDDYHFTACLLADDRPIGTIGLFDLDLRNGNAGL